MKSKIYRPSYSETLIISFIAVLSIIFWDSYLIYPIKIFVIFLHEISHAIATILTGGSVNEIFISFDLGGYTLTSGGNQLVITSAGYLGSLFLGAILFVAAYNKKYTKLICTILALLILLNTIGYIQHGNQIVFGLLISVFLFFVPKYLDEVLLSYILKFIGLTSSLYVLSDIKDDLFTTSIRETDAQAIEFLTEIPSLLIASIWLLISILTIFFLIKYSFRKRTY